MQISAQASQWPVHLRTAQKTNDSFHVKEKGLEQELGHLLDSLSIQETVPQLSKIPVP